MKRSDRAHIAITRIIHADQQKVTRLLTRVWEFPSYVATVKEVSVLESGHRSLVTQWKISIDSVPISWVEKDTLSVRGDTIRFEAIKGDLEEFKGVWRLAPHPEGTRVSLAVDVAMTIPGIADFALEYMRKIVTMNFEAILNAIEQRAVSLRYARFKSGEIDAVGGFAIIGHLYNFYHLERCLKKLNPSFTMPSREFIGNLFNVTPSFKLYDILNYTSKTGQSVNGCFIVATFIPDLIEKDIWSIFSKVVKACKIAEKHGMGIVTLGGFTSIVAERVDSQLKSVVDVPVTTGNTFTAAMTLDGVVKAAELFEIDLAQAKVAIVGGTGDIGSACARVLASEVKELVITGRTRSNLDYLRGELAKKRKARVFATSDNHAAVRGADIVIAAASATSSILSIDWFKPRAIVCDVGYPKNISYLPIERKDIFIFSGGLASAPTPITFPIDIGLPSADTVYGCFAEAIILALERRYENFSYGRGNITPENIDQMREMGARHGFGVSPFYWGDCLVDTQIIERIKKAASRSNHT